MLSILIPTYQYNIVPLVEELHRQCVEQPNLIFEILINDDASTYDGENPSIERLSNCFYYKQHTNKGLSASRNFLIEKARYSWCLFLDDDVAPLSPTFISTYIQQIQSGIEPCILYGGLQYRITPPETCELLRWKYGRKHEALSYDKRLKDKKNHFLCSNFVVHRTILDRYTFPKEINTYGYEDLIFNKKIQEANIPIYQIDNAVYHEKLDTSQIFLTKTKKALDNLKKSIDLQLLPKDATQISQFYFRWNQAWLKQFVIWGFRCVQTILEKILVSRYTSLRIYNLYRIGYFYSIQK